MIHVFARVGDVSYWTEDHQFVLQESNPGIESIHVIQLILRLRYSSAQSDVSGVMRLVADPGDQSGHGHPIQLGYRLLSLQRRNKHETQESILYYLLTECLHWCGPYSRMSGSASECDAMSVGVPQGFLYTGKIINCWQGVQRGCREQKQLLKFQCFNTLKSF